jgi:hypothetical protein
MTRFAPSWRTVRQCRRGNCRGHCCHAATLCLGREGTEAGWRALVSLWSVLPCGGNPRRRDRLLSRQARPEALATARIVREPGDGTFIPAITWERWKRSVWEHVYPSAYRSHTLNFWRYSGRNSLPIPGLSGARTALFTMRSRSNVDSVPLKLPDSI